MQASLFDAINIAGLVALLGLFFVMLRYRRQPGRQRQERDMAYEWVAEPAHRAAPELLAKFGPDAPRGKDITLVRMGFFNAGTSEILPDETVRPLAVLFPEGTRVLLARFGEAVKNDRPQPPPPVAGEARVEFPPFALAPGGVVVFNLAVSGNARPRGIEGTIRGIDSLRRLA